MFFFLADFMMYFFAIRAGFFLYYICFSILVDLENEDYFYSACLNPTNIILVTVLGMIIGKGAWYSERQVRNH
jgi:hypothetical protein